MKRVFYIFFPLALLSCRKDQPLPKINYDSNPTELIKHCIGDYDLYSTDTFDYNKQHINAILYLPTYVFPDNYLYSLPIFNPNNPYEIIYKRRHKNDSGLDSEIWKFSFCTGESSFIANNFYYNLDWGSNGWILYTGTGHKIHKIKDNGDSLTVLSTQPGYNRAGKWNPSGTLYWNSRDDGYYILNENNAIVSTLTHLPFDWYNDTTVLVLGPGYTISSLNIYSNTIMQLNSNWTPYIATHLYDRTHNTCYVTLDNGDGVDDYFLRYDLSGTNKVDTLSKMYDSYKYGGGDIANNKIITTLNRLHWKNINNNEMYFRYNLLLMDLDGTNERLINLPE